MKRMGVGARVGEEVWGAGVPLPGEACEEELAQWRAWEAEVLTESGMFGDGDGLEFWALLGEAEEVQAGEGRDVPAGAGQQRQVGLAEVGQRGQVGLAEVGQQEGPAAAQWVDPAVTVADGLSVAVRGMGQVVGVGAVGGLGRVQEQDLVAGLEEAGRARALAVGAVVGLARECWVRGLHAQVGMSLVAWLRVRCAWLSRAEAAQVQDVVRAGDAHWGPELVVAVAAGRTGLHRGALVARTIHRLVPCLSVEQAGVYAEIAIEAAKNPGISDVDLDRVCQQLLIDLLDKKPREEAKATAQGLRCVSRRDLGRGMTRFTVDAPQVEAALIEGVLAGPLAAPVPDKEAGQELDLRSPGQRKFDALLMVINRGLSNPGAPPSSGRASVMVTVKADPATGRPVGAGLTHTGTVLDADQVGRLACVGDLTPVVLGEHGEPLNLGRTVRLATPGQFKALMVRDGQCTYPGCDVPGTWCDAHHLIWWCRGGGTDIAYLVLLCPRHHTLVHDKDLTATVAGSVVTWHV